jgi:hypothetical protein
LGGETVRWEVLIFGGKEANNAFLTSALYGVTNFALQTIYPCGEIERYPVIKETGWPPDY